jgi:hypothetical protein
MFLESYQITKIGYYNTYTYTLSHTQTYMQRERGRENYLNVFLDILYLNLNILLHDLLEINTTVNTN